MLKKSIFIKISCDLINKKEVLDYLSEISKENFIVICTGWWTQINNEFQKRWLEITFWPLWREINTFEWRQLARNILENNQKEIQDLLADKWIKAEIVIPVSEIGTVLCHINWDIFALNAYNWFEELQIFTLKERLENKKQEFIKYPKIKVIGF